MDYSMPGFSVHHQLPEFTQTHVHRVSDAIQPSHPLSSPSYPAFNLSQLKGLSQWVSSHPVAKVLEFQLQISPSNEYSVLISFRMDWLDLLTVQGTLKSLLQHHSSKPSILRHSAFLTVQLSHWYMTAGKTIPLIWRTLVGEVMSLLFNMLSRLVIASLSKSKCLLLSACLMSIYFPALLLCLLPHHLAQVWKLSSPSSYCLSVPLVCCLLASEFLQDSYLRTLHSTPPLCFSFFLPYPQFQDFLDWRHSKSCGVRHTIWIWT